MDVAIKEDEMTVVVTAAGTVEQRRQYRLTPRQSDDLRRLFWKVLRDLPVPQTSSRPADGVSFEVTFNTYERTYRTSMRGALSAAEYDAFDHLNTLLPAEYQFAVDWGPRRRRP